MRPHNFCAVIGSGPVGIRVAQILLGAGVKVVHFDISDSKVGEEAQLLLRSNITLPDIYTRHCILGQSPKNPWGGCLMGYSWNEAAILDYDFLYRGLTPRVFKDTADFFSVKGFDLSMDVEIDQHPAQFDGLRRVFGVFARDPLLSGIRRNLTDNPNYTLITGKQLVEILIGGRENTLRLLNLRNNVIENLVVNQVFLCCGTIENTRVLLNTQRLNNLPSGNLGENLGDHIALDIGIVKGKSVQHLRNFFGSFSVQQNKLIPRFKLESNEQQNQMFRSFLQVSSLDNIVSANSNTFFKKGTSKKLLSRLVPGVGIASIIVEALPKVERRVNFVEDTARKALELSLLIEESEFNQYLEIGSKYIESLKSNSELSVTDNLDNVTIGELRSALHWSGTTRLGAESIMNEDGSTLWSEYLFAVGGNLLPCPDATHPTFVATALSQVIVERALERDIW